MTFLAIAIAALALVEGTVGFIAGYYVGVLTVKLRYARG